MPRIVRGALLQATWTGDKESMIQKHEAAAHEAAKQGGPQVGQSHPTAPSSKCITPSASTARPRSDTTALRGSGP